MNDKAKILIIDDDEALLVSCTKVLQNNGHCDIITVTDSHKALREIESGEYDLIISDLAMPDMTGMELLHKARLSVPETPFVIFSAYGNVERAVEAMREGAFDFIEKPFKAERLRVVVEKSLHHRNLHKEKQALESELQRKYGLDNIIGRSQPMLQVFDLITRVAKGESNITVVGESGTGKELVARSIHSQSSRKNKAFVPVNCGAFPENLFESELFGYEKGAFTGAHRRKHGLLEFADGGTFFLDEICELSPTLQVKLLRMLQDRKIRRVGGNELLEVDVRIISATNQNLEQALKEGSLREDLYYRLNVISIQLPPLRDRREDIPLLCIHFIKKFSRATPKSIKGVSEEALRCLENYNWPGNVRELENVIERAITFATDDWIQVKDLPEKLTQQQTENRPVQVDIPLKDAKAKIVSQFERDYLTQMLIRHNGNVTKAARDSGIDRRTFHRLLNRHRIDSKVWKQ
ncbi:sigma-54-dependent Fis family transcriptional regulator [candidate division KSB1 bacterium]|nr:sigma-54-dependent Fis family transcriptional regulator [candidate division KSB1 bacterium]NIR70903.1 sigma-54-dependent Fis family transcriptional regulator [candidate division KSB1 bacterium]NIS24673.1 sigma-54-dependent Fis family transcriptional regulator [candidate division KSB1 bacterium]NIT71575.1 sigma-54-dependent Fis family transcriptional regulator [candidate division KSB1 bacterium]NIU25273.1 sigma-54-dependent Fis family transcriptional regulator [candidate division KSB1 bacteri